jgi:hypothetical protein
MPMRFPTLFLLAALLVMVGCRHHTLRVEGYANLPVGAKQVSVASNQKFLLPGEIGPLPLPAFPEHHALPTGTAVTLCVSYTVTDEGDVQDVQFERFPGEPCALEQSESLNAMRKSILDTLERWPYFAAAVCEFETADAAETSDDECTGALSVTPVAVRLAWRFVFTIDSNGNAEVVTRNAR